MFLEVGIISWQLYEWCWLLFMSQVEGKHGSFWCFYLSENLNENRDYILRAQKDDEEGDMFNLPQALPEALGHHCGKWSCSCISVIKVGVIACSLAVQTCFYHLNLFFSPSEFLSFYFKFWITATFVIFLFSCLLLYCLFHHCIVFWF